MSLESFAEFDRLWQLLGDEFALMDPDLHGPKHWRSVEANGVEIAEHSGADERVVRLFAVFHDCKRENNGYDPEHGHRAAERALELHGQFFQLEERQLETLVTACRFHNDGEVSSCPTIGTCWDADRLDLPRVGMIPEAQYISTDYAKQLIQERYE